jgi:hypothetical protein
MEGLLILQKINNYIAFLDVFQIANQSVRLLISKDLGFVKMFGYSSELPLSIIVKLIAHVTLPEPRNHRRQFSPFLYTRK